jgi:hypothetical protein
MSHLFFVYGMKGPEIYSFINEQENRSLSCDRIKKL